MIKLLLLLSGVLSVTFFNGIANGFEKHEHLHVSNKGLILAIEFLGKQTEFCAIPGVSDLVLECFPQKNRITYGDITQQIDHFFYPIEIFETQKSCEKDLLKNLGQDESGCSIGRPVSLSDLHVKLQSAEPEESFLDWASSTTNNKHHFQGQALNHFTKLHADAVSYACQGDLFTALVMNAMADHFLQDFFAPGHITTTRENSHDAVALGIHDASNKHGANFTFNSRRFTEDISPLLKFMMNQKQGHEYFINAPDRKPPDLAEIGNQLINIDDAIRLLGDNYLSIAPKQTLYMIAINARSILDVLQSYIESPAITGQSACNPYNSFSEYTWTGTYDFDSGKDIVPIAGITYGFYDLTLEDMSRASSILMLAVGGEAPYYESHSSRGVIALEYVPLKFIGDSEFLRKNTINRPSTACNFFSLCNIGPAFGVSYIHDDRFDATGLTARFIKVLPKIDVQLSLGAKWYSYKSDQDDIADTSKLSTMLRADIGFSFFSGFVYLEDGFGVSGGEFERDKIFGFGMAVGMPTSRIVD